MAGLHGRLCISGRVGRQPEFSRTDQLIEWDPPSREEAGRELVKRYRHLYGESNLEDFTEWSGLAKPHAKALWELEPREGQP